MTTGYYRGDRAVYDRTYSEKEYFMGDRFYPGELGMVALLAIAGLLVWSIAIYGIFSDRAPSLAYMLSNGNYASSDLNTTPNSAY